MTPQERNRIQLKKGLQQLPEYSPPDNLWNKIEVGMSGKEGKKETSKKSDLKGSVLHDAIQRLPAYEPEDALWDKISAGLDASGEYAREENIAVQPAKVKKLSWTRWAAAASVILLIGGGAFWLINHAGLGEEKVAITYSEELRFDGVRTSDEVASQEIDFVIDEVKKVNFAWSHPETVALNASLESIRIAIHQVEAAGEKYGFDETMHQRLTNMYTKRNKIVRQLAAKI